MQVLAQKHTPRCVQYFSEPTRELLAVGTSRATVLLFVLRAPTAHSAQQGVWLPSDSAVEACPVVCMDFSDDGAYLLAATFKAQLLFYALSPPTAPKLLKSFSHVHQGVPLSLQCFGEQMGPSGYFNFVSSGSCGLTQSNRIRKSTFSYGLERNTLLTQDVFH